MFEIAAKRCGMTLSEGGWVIGDNPTADIAGGRAVGLRTIWIDRGTSLGVDHQADHVVGDVLQAIEGDAGGRFGTLLKADDFDALAESHCSCGRVRCTAQGPRYQWHVLRGR
nr:HAD hydrolase-like protein [Microbispora catharanthi]